MMYTKYLRGLLLFIFSLFGLVHCFLYYPFGNKVKKETFYVDRINKKSYFMHLMVVSVICDDSVTCIWVSMSIWPRRPMFVAMCGNGNAPGHQRLKWAWQDLCRGNDGPSPTGRGNASEWLDSGSVTSWQLSVSGVDLPPMAMPGNGVNWPVQGSTPTQPV